MIDPRDDEDIDFLARYAYRLGKDPVTFAAEHVSMLLEVHAQVWNDRTENPALWPGYCIELTWAAAARRIIGNLMDAGWTAPKIPEHEPMAGCDR